MSVGLEGIAENCMITAAEFELAPALRRVVLKVKKRLELLACRPFSRASGEWRQRAPALGEWLTALSPSDARRPPDPGEFRESFRSAIKANMARRGIADSKTRSSLAHVPCMKPGIRLRRPTPPETR